MWLIQVTGKLAFIISPAQNSQQLFFPFFPFFSPPFFFSSSLSSRMGGGGGCMAALHVNTQPKEAQWLR